MTAKQSVDAARPLGPGSSETPETSSLQLRALLIAGGLYSLLALIIWSPSWLCHPTGISTCACGDPSLFTWFLTRPAYALSHGRLSDVTYLTVAVMLALIVDHVHLAVMPKNSRPPFGTLSPFGTQSPILGPSDAGLIVAAIALFPIAAYLAEGIPVTTQSVAVSTWFQTVGPHLTRHQVLLVLPAPLSLVQSATTWQALDGMSYSMVGGGGPQSVLPRAGKERTGQAILEEVTDPPSPTLTTITPGDVTAVRQALED